MVILTAFSQRDLVERARDAGAMAYLVKPFSKADLLPAIEMAVSRYSELQLLATEVADLGEQLATRKVVDRAKGILQRQMGLSEPEAFRWVQKTAMDLRRSMREVAEGVVQHGPDADRKRRVGRRALVAHGPEVTKSQRQDSPGDVMPRVCGGFRQYLHPIHVPLAAHRPSHDGGSMIRPTRTWRAIAVCGAAALVLAACGSESSDEEGQRRVGLRLDGGQG